MDYEDIANTIRTQFKALIADVYNVVTQYDNHKITTPDDAVWVRLKTVFDDAKQKSFGAPTKRYRFTGTMVAEVNYPIGLGDAASYEVVGNIIDAFKTVTFSGVSFKTPYPVVFGRTGDSWRIDAICPFQGDIIQ